MIDRWSTPDYGYTNDEIYTSADFDFNDFTSDSRLKVVFTIPELGIRTSRGPYAVSGGGTRIHRSLEIPYYAEPGEYVIRMTVYENGKKRVKHRFITIDDYY